MIATISFECSKCKKTFVPDEIFGPSCPICGSTLAQTIVSKVEVLKPNEVMGKKEEAKDCC